MIKKHKPKTPGRRHYSVSDYSVLTAEKPFKKLTKSLKKDVGRSKGQITVRHKGGGSKKLYREIFFGQEKKGIPGTVKSIEYDPNRSAFISLISYADGAWGYILSPQGLKEGSKIICDEKTPLKKGNRMMLKNIPVGAFVHNIETKSGAGGKLARSAGSFAQVVAQDGVHTHFKMPSSEIRKISNQYYASLGQLSNVERKMVSLGKAGRSRHLGRRPKVRGTAMNPVDHPYGGGEGRTQRGTRRPKNIYGKVTGGKKTRKKKRYSDKFIVSRRKKK
ncbi:MAG: 50S ribosomal protein L2 [Candidatus Pacebacteria bacterium]|jgi:large subunit ribosomal protein L2|nr:50S ribosomal protein L2 [Candidatus Paceibacterota bacterium]